MAQPKLHVAAADALAKSRRAAEASSVKTVVLGAPTVESHATRTPPPAGRPPARAPIPGMTRDEYERTRVFSQAVDVARPPPSPLQALVMTLLDGSGGGGGGDRAADKVVREKVLPVLETVSGVVSKLPDPTLAVLAVVLCCLSMCLFQPETLGRLRWIGAALLMLLFNCVVMPVVAVWGRTDMFAMMREGSNPFHHPQEGVMDRMEAELAAGEKRVSDGFKSLQEGRAKFEELKKELAKDTLLGTPGVTIVPSKKAMALIIDGALGDSSYRAGDEEAAEAKRKHDARLRSQLEWRARNEEAEGEAEETKENMKRLVNHAGSVYPERTRELRTKANTGNGPTLGPDRLRAKAGATLASFPGRRRDRNGTQTCSTGSTPPVSPGLSAASAPATSGTGGVKASRGFGWRKKSGRNSEGPKSGRSLSYRSNSSVVSEAAAQSAPAYPSSKRRIFRQKRKPSDSAIREPSIVDASQ